MRHQGTFIPGFQEVEPAPEPKRRVEFSAALQLVAAFIAMISTLIGLNDKHPNLARYIWPFGIIVLLWIAKPQLNGGFVSLRNRFGDRRFVKRERRRLQDFLSRFNRFASLDGPRRFSEVLRSAQDADGYSLGVQINDFIPGWIDCFRKQVKRETHSFETFIEQCREFTLIVSCFNTSYLIRAQEQIQKEKPLSAESLHRLEEFREEFIAFLRDLEQWVVPLTERIQERFGERQWALAPIPNFTRVKTFRRVAGQAV